MMEQFTIVDQLLRHRPQLLAISANLFTRGTAVWVGPGGPVAEDGWSKNPARLDGRARGSVRRKGVQGHILAAGATKGGEAEVGGFNCRDAVESVAKVVLCVGFLHVGGRSAKVNVAEETRMSTARGAYFRDQASY